MLKKCKEQGVNYKEIAEGQAAGGTNFGEERGVNIEPCKKSPFIQGRGYREPLVISTEKKRRRPGCERKGGHGFTKAKGGKNFKKGIVSSFKSAEGSRKVSTEKDKCVWIK